MDTKEKTKISTKWILIYICIFLLLSASTTFGYLYFSSQNKDCNPVVQKDEPADDTSGEIIKSDEDENTPEETEKVVECNYEGIQESLKNDSNRYHLLYGLMFGDRTERHVACNKFLKTKLYSILDSNSEKYEDGEIRDMKQEIYNDRIDYLIDNTFLVYSYGHLYEIDIVKETINLMWGVESPVEIDGLYVYGEDSRSTLVFLTHEYGLGGDASETENINNLIKGVCDKDQLGIFMYSTDTKKFNMISENEICK